MPARRLRLVAAVLLVLGAPALGGGCGGKKGEAEEPRTSPLYERLGEEDGIGKIVETFLANVAADERINAYFPEDARADLAETLTAQLCAAAGGPCGYEGKNLRDAHVGMGVTEAQFAALVENLEQALARAGVTPADQRALLDQVGADKREVVEEPVLE